MDTTPQPLPCIQAVCANETRRIGFLNTLVERYAGDGYLFPNAPANVPHNARSIAKSIARDSARGLYPVSEGFYHSDWKGYIAARKALAALERTGIEGIKEAKGIISNPQTSAPARAGAMSVCARWRTALHMATIVRSLMDERIKAIAAVRRLLADTQTHLRTGNTEAWQATINLPPQLLAQRTFSSVPLLHLLGTTATAEDIALATQQTLAMWTGRPA